MVDLGAPPGSDGTMIYTGEAEGGTTIIHDAAHVIHRGGRVDSGTTVVHGLTQVMNGTTVANDSSAARQDGTTVIHDGIAAITQGGTGGGGGGGCRGSGAQPAFLAHTLKLEPPTGPPADGASLQPAEAAGSASAASAEAASAAALAELTEQPATADRLAQPERRELLPRTPPGAAVPSPVIVPGSAHACAFAAGPVSHGRSVGKGGMAWTVDEQMMMSVESATRSLLSGSGGPPTGGGAGGTDGSRAHSGACGSSGGGEAAGGGANAALSSSSHAAANAAPHSANGQSAAASAKYDFSHLSIAEINELLSTQQADFERDVGKLRKQYEKRGKALKAARAAKQAESERTAAAGLKAAPVMAS